VEGTDGEIAGRRNGSIRRNDELFCRFGLCRGIGSDYFRYTIKAKTMNNSFEARNYNEDQINSFTVFGEFKKRIVSKNFKGGTIKNLFGGTELDFTNADIDGVAILDISQAFGETKITVPKDWTVETRLSQLLAGVDDKRTSMENMPAKQKVLVLEGASVFAGINIRSCQ
jgi:predicted membrane protein